MIFCCFLFVFEGNVTNKSKRGSITWLRVRTAKSRTDECCHLSANTDTVSSTSLSVRLCTGHEASLEICVGQQNHFISNCSNDQHTILVIEGDTRVVSCGSLVVGTARDGFIHFPFLSETNVMMNFSSKWKQIKFDWIYLLVTSIS